MTSRRRPSPCTVRGADVWWFVLAGLLLSAGVASAGQRGSSARTTAPADITCPSELGTGITTDRRFCNVATGRDPADGILIKIPPHRGETRLLFDLHNRQTYSPEEERTGRAYTRATAYVGILNMNNDLIARALVQSEFRTSKDLFDRVGGGAGPTGLKAVAPVSIEPVSVTLPAALDEVSLLGEKLVVATAHGEFTYASPGQPIALVSNIRVEYQPARRRR
jgi:hypothetical protein